LFWLESVTYPLIALSIFVKVIFSPFKSFAVARMKICFHTKPRIAGVAESSYDWLRNRHLLELEVVK
jgi:hypothetical protein